ncbi:hypothetical protein COOONC_15782 [Cooperia oncophora]
MDSDDDDLQVIYESCNGVAKVGKEEIKIQNKQDDDSSENCSSSASAGSNAQTDNGEYQIWRKEDGLLEHLYPSSSATFSIRL